MRIASRPIEQLLVGPFDPANYAVLFRMARVYPQFLQYLVRYVSGAGTYPLCASVRAGKQMLRPTLYSHADLLTLNEIFARQDYALPPGVKPEVIVDIGANIGLSALYFLSLNDTCFCYLYEPDTRNTDRLRRNLKDFSQRYALVEKAVANRRGKVPFGIEPTGRYGGIGLLQRPELIQVECVHIDDVLVDVLTKHESIDLLKIDIEGLEIETLYAIDEQYLDRIKMIIYEGPGGCERISGPELKQCRRAKTAPPRDLTNGPIS